MLFDVGRIGRQTATKTHAMTDAGVYTSPTLDLDLTSGVLDSRVTFTRAAGSQSSFDSTGTMVFPGTNVPRFDYDPVTLAPKGLLIEEARTNLALQSNSPGAWTTVAATVVPAVILAPDGTMTGAFLQEDLTNNVHNATAPQTILTATVYTHSCFVKAGSRTVVGLSGAGLNGAGLQPAFNLITGADVSTGTHANFFHGIYPVGNGWYRIWATWTSTNTTGFDVELLTGTRSYPGDGVSGLYIWGAQTEAGAFGTSLIISGVSALARAADAFTLASGSLFLTPAATLVVEGLALQNPAAGTNVAWIFLDDGTANNVLEVVGPSASANLRFVATAGGAALMNAGDTSPGTRPIVFKAGIGGDVAATRGALNGVITLTGPGGTFGPMNRLRAGTGGVSPINGYIRRVTYWPRLLSVAELTAATT